jgi:hypothetical protein
MLMGLLLREDKHAPQQQKKPAKQTKQPASSSKSKPPSTGKFFEGRQPPFLLRPRPSQSMCIFVSIIRLLLGRLGLGPLGLCFI